MALNLHRSGFLGAIWNRTRARAEALRAETGVYVAESVAELAACCQLIVTSVSRDADATAVVEAMLPGLKPGTVIADTSTTARDTARRLAETVATRGAHFLDAPVSGGVEGARRGTLVMMIGGDAAVLEQVRGPLSVIASRIVHIGPVGSGQATKAVNQLMAAGINQAVTEALAFGCALGLPMDKVVEVVKGGAAANWLLDHRGLSMLEGRFEPGFQVMLHHKDLRICAQMAKALGVSTLPVVEMTLTDYQRLMDEGYGTEDLSALFRLKMRRYQGEGG